MRAGPVTGKQPEAWVGDQVRDGDADKEGIVSDVQRDVTTLPQRPPTARVS